MAEFSELIKNFHKIRDFMRDFYIYGFKSREEFARKSARTYDNEKRRCESYLGENMKWMYIGGTKVSFVSVDCEKISANPLYSAWKSKSFTDNDIMLHFYLLDALRMSAKTADELTNEISLGSGKVFDLQTVRGKCKEYAETGIFTSIKKGKSYLYGIAEDKFEADAELLNAVKFFQSQTFGVIGRFLLDRFDVENDLFVFKHHYIAHTLEDGVLIDLLTAMREHRKVELELVGSKSGIAVKQRLIPMKILCSFWSGRRYLCAYLPSARRFSSFRLDSVKSVRLWEEETAYLQLQDSLSRNIDKVWGVSFNGESRHRTGFSVVLRIDGKNEKDILDRIKKESRGGILEQIGDHAFRFTKDVFDANEAMPWIKTFIGRIVAFEATERLETKLRSDIRRMARMYEAGECE